MIINKPKYDFKNVALYHLNMTRHNIYSDIELFKNSNYVGKELVVLELERLFNKFTYIENELKELKETDA